MPPSVTRWLRREDGELVADVSSRFWAKVGLKDENGCWPWLNRKGSTRYGSFGLGPRRLGTMPAHRVAYELAKGRIPDGAVIDHICRNTLCCNPNHMRAVTNQENIVAGVGPSAQNARKTHCRKGHPLTGENVKIEASGRRCMQCKREREARTRGYKSSRWMPVEEP